MKLLPRLMLGTAPMGGLFEPVSDEAAAHTLEAAWQAGIRAFDTAPHYGAGLSEQRLGAFLASKPRSEYLLSTKVGRLLVPADGPVEGAEGFYGTPPLTRAGHRRRRLPRHRSPASIARCPGPPLIVELITVALGRVPA